MPHVSKKKLDQVFQDKLFAKLFSMLERAQNEKLITGAMDELFTDTEKIMFAKRLGIILMLTSKTPQNKVVEVLKVSPSTVAITALGLQKGKYSNIVKVSKKEKVDLEKIVWSILTVGGIMPPKVGRIYWRKKSSK